MSTIKQTLANHKNTVIISATVALIVIACAFAVYLRLYTGKELWYEMFAAIIGVIITAIITMMLLVGQTDSDEKREKKGKVFEEKLRIYQEYLDTLYDVLKDGNNTASEKLRLAFSTSKVAMHCPPERIEHISECVKDIFKHLINDKGDALGNMKKDEWEKVLAKLFKVMDEFKADLYPDIKDKATFNWGKTLENFKEAFGQDKAETTAPNAVANSMEDDITDTAEADLSDWEEKKKEWTDRGWLVDDYMAERNGFMLKIPNTKRNPYIDVGWFEGHYYIQASYHKDPNFAKALKWEKGGRRSYGTWWKHFENQFYDIPEGELYNRFSKGPELRKYIYDKVEELMPVMEQEDNTMKWYDSMMQKVDKDKWYVFTWYWNTLACELRSEAFGKPFIDVRKNDGKVTLQLYNRADNREAAEKLIKSIGGDMKFIIDKDNGRYNLDAEINDNADEITALVAKLTKRIETELDKSNPNTHSTNT